MVSRVPQQEVAALNSVQDLTRHSRVAYAVVKLRVRGQDYLLLNAHRKWGDWSFVGGHVERSDADFWAAAAREASEELAPLSHGVDMEIRRDRLACSEWGPISSSSAGGALTTYQAMFYLLEFKASPRACLARLPRGEFRLIRISELEGHSEVSAIVKNFDQLLAGGWRALPLSWADDLEDAPLRASASNHAVPAE
jgi:hypothetical protein